MTLKNITANPLQYFLQCSTMTVISSTILALKDSAMSKLKNSTDLAIDKYNHLIVCDNGEKEKFSLWMEDFSIW